MPGDSSADSSAHLSATVAELSAVTDAVQRSRHRVGDLATPFVGSPREDIMSAIYEAERALLAAERTLQRALKTIQR